MRPRKKDEGSADSEFPTEEWFGGPDDYFYPHMPAFFAMLLRPDGKLFKVLKAKKVQNVKHPVNYGCFLCKRWLQPDQVEEHLAGKTHLAGIKQIQHSMEIISIDHPMFSSKHQEMSGRPPPAALMSQCIGGSTVNNNSSLNHPPTAPPPWQPPSYISPLSWGQPAMFGNRLYLPPHGVPPPSVRYLPRFPGSLPPPVATVSPLVPPPTRQPVSPTAVAIEKQSEPPAEIISTPPGKSSPAVEVPAPVDIHVAPSQPPDTATQQQQASGNSIESTPPAITISATTTTATAAPAATTFAATAAPHPPQASKVGGFLAALPRPVPAKAVDKPAVAVPAPILLPLPVDFSVPPPSMQAASPHFYSKLVAVRDREPDIQAYLDTCTDQHFVGIEYVVEIQDAGPFKQPHFYTCRLCNIMYKPRGDKLLLDDMRLHLSMNSHKIKYLARHFPKVYAHKLKSPNVDIINDIVQKIESKYGRLKPLLAVGNAVGKVNYDELNKLVEQGDHIREDEDFISFMLDKSAMPEKEDAADQIFLESCLSPVSDAGENLSFSLSPSSDHEPGVSDTDHEVKTTEEPSSAKDNSQSSPRTAKELSSVSEQSIVEASENADATMKESSKARPGSLSPVSDKEVEVLDDGLSPEERRTKFRLERQKRVEAFNADVKLMEEALEKQKKIWSDEPDKHCDYEREWKKFWDRKRAELLFKGLDPRNFDMTSEWTLVWKAYFEADIAARIKQQREILMRKHKVLSRDLVADVDFSKPPPGGGRVVSSSPTHSAISSSSSLAGGKNESQMSLGTGTSRERCSSPWEVDGGPPISSVHHHSRPRIDSPARTVVFASPSPDLKRGGSPVARKPLFPGYEDRSRLDRASPIEGRSRLDLSPDWSRWETASPSRDRSSRWRSRSPADRRDVWDRRIKASPRDKGRERSRSTSRRSISPLVRKERRDSWEREIRESCPQFRDLRDRDFRDRGSRDKDFRHRDPRDRDVSDSWDRNSPGRDSRDQGPRSSRNRSPARLRSAEKAGDGYEDSFEGPSKRPRIDRMSVDRWRAPSPPQRRSRFPSSEWSPSSHRLATESSTVTASTESTSEVSVLSALRLMSGLEPTGLIRDLGAQVDLQLAAAIGLENREGFGSSLQLVDNKETYLLLTDVRGRLQTKMMSGVTTEAENNVCRIIVDQVTILLQRSRLRPEDFTRKPVAAAVAPAATAAAPQLPILDETEKLIKMAIARSVDQQLRAAGRAVSQAEFAALVEAEYIRLKNQLPSQLTAVAGTTAASSTAASSTEASSTAARTDAVSILQEKLPATSYQKQHLPSPLPSQKQQLPSPPVENRKFSPSSPYQKQQQLLPVPVLMPEQMELSSLHKKPLPPSHSELSLDRPKGVPAAVSPAAPLPPAAAASLIPPAAARGTLRIIHEAVPIPLLEPSKPPPPPPPAFSAPVPNIDWNSLSNILKTVQDVKPTEAANAAGPPSDAHARDMDVDDIKQEMIHEEEEEEVQVKMEADPFDDLTDEELVSLLSNFKTLSPGDQQNLVCYMKKMEQDDPYRVQRLKEETARARRC